MTELEYRDNTTVVSELPNTKMKWKRYELAKNCRGKPSMSFLCFWLMNNIRVYWHHVYVAMYLSSHFSYSIKTSRVQCIATLIYYKYSYIQKNELHNRS